MVALRYASRVVSLTLGIALAVIAGCGGGSSAPAGNSGGGDDEPPTDGPAGVCGIPQASGLSSPGPAEGIWRGRVEIWAGTYLFAVYPLSGLVTADGEAYFQVGSSQLWAGTVLASESGVRTSVTPYWRSADGGLGGSNDAPISSAHLNLTFSDATSRTSLTGRFTAYPFASCEDFELQFDDGYLRPASLSSVAGVYSAAEEDGYTLTVTIHADGQLDGSDTRGCVLYGDVTIPDSTKNIYRAVVAASSCATLNGHFEGLMYQQDFAQPDDNASLVMLLSNGDNAIFYTLTR
jgi:hypothetical protein